MDLQTVLKEIELFEREYHDPCARALCLFREVFHLSITLFHGLNWTNDDQAKMDIFGKMLMLYCRIGALLSSAQHEEVEARFNREIKFNYIHKDELC